MQLIDLSHTIGPGMPRFSDDWPETVITPHLSHTQSAFSGRYLGTTVEISSAHFVTSVGTYLDSPFHYNPEGTPIDRLDLQQLVLPGVVVDCRAYGPRQPIGPEVLAGIDCAGKAVLLNSGWGHYWGLENYREHPFVGAELAVALRDADARLVGVDFLIADDPQDAHRPAHVTLLHANILIVENLIHLDQIPAEPFVFHAVPPKFAQAASFPVRAYAVVG